MSEIELRITEIISNQDWAADPDMVAVTVNIDQAPVAIVSQIRTMLRLTQS